MSHPDDCHIMHITCAYIILQFPLSPLFWLGNLKKGPGLTNFGPHRMEFGQHPNLRIYMDGILVFDVFFIFDLFFIKYNQFQLWNHCIWIPSPDDNFSLFL